MEMMNTTSKIEPGAVNAKGLKKQHPGFQGPEAVKIGTALTTLERGVALIASKLSKAKAPLSKVDPVAAGVYKSTERVVGKEMALPAATNEIVNASNQPLETALSAVPRAKGKKFIPGANITGTMKSAQ